MSQITDALKSRGGRGSRVAPAAVLACWSAGALVFAVFPAGSDGRYLVANALYLGAAVFAVFSLARAIGGAHGRQRLFWGLLGANFAGDLGWSEIQQTPLGAQGAALPHAAYLVSYLFFGGALLLLLELATRRITLVTSLDALCIALSTGLLAWYFFLGAAVSGRPDGGRCPPSSRGYCSTPRCSSSAWWSSPRSRGHRSRGRSPGASSRSRWRTGTTSWRGRLAPTSPRAGPT